MQRQTKYTLKHNLIIKKPVPAVGIICSNPRRAERIALHNLQHVKLLDEYHSAWPLDIYVGSYKGKSVFVAAVAIGAAGAAFAISELVTAGANYIIRYGSNDDPTLTKERMQEVIIVEQADNLYGLMQSAGISKEKWGSKLFASRELINELYHQAEYLGIKSHAAICHHIEDYHAYAYPQLAGEQYCQNIINDINRLESKKETLLHSRDMETAALFLRAQLDGFHAATILQNVPKYAGTHQAYDGRQGEIARQLESTFSQFIFSVLIKYADDYKL